MAYKRNPQMQVQNSLNRARGKKFEQAIDNSLLIYQQQGFASIEKTPEPMRVLENLGMGKFLAIFTKKAQPDYEGTVKGGRSVKFEAKYTSTDRMTQSVVRGHQTEHLEIHHKLGAHCFVVIGFSSGNVYRLPWEVWRDMKIHFGRKYVKEDDLQKYRVAVGTTGNLLLLGKTGRSNNNE